MVAGLQWWLNAGSITGVAAGGAVAAWNDISGNGYNLAQASAPAQPTWQPGIINNQPVVRFGGAAWMDAGNVFSINDTLTLLAVFTNATTTRQTILGQENAANALQFEVNNSNGGATDGAIQILINGTYVTSAIAARFSVNMPKIVAYTRNGAGASHAWYDSGRLLVTATNNTNSYSGDGSKIIGRRSAGTQLFNGDLAELILWNTLLGAADLNRAFVYLSRKYGILNAARLDY